VIRPCVSSKIRLQDIVGATVGREKGLEPSKGVDADKAPVVDPVFAGGLDHANRAGNRGNLWEKRDVYDFMLFIGGWVWKVSVFNAAKHVPEFLFLPK